MLVVRSVRELDDLPAYLELVHVLLAVVRAFGYRVRVLRLSFVVLSLLGPVVRAVRDVHEVLAVDHVGEIVRSLVHSGVDISIVRSGKVTQRLTYCFDHVLAVRTARVEEHLQRVVGLRRFDEVAVSGVGRKLS